MTNEQQPTDKRLADMERRISKGEAERERMLREMQDLGSRFERHEDRVMERMEKGNDWMRQMNESLAHVTASFESFVEWFKFAFKWTMLIVLGVLGPAVAGIGIYLAYTNGG